jgi:hypothetical protein
VRDVRGEVIDVVPAYPDADPGYHTALSLIDALDLIQVRTIQLPYKGISGVPTEQSGTVRSATGNAIASSTYSVG